MHRNTELNTISCVPVQDIGKWMKKETKKVKKDWKKVLTKGDRGGIIVKLSRETAITTEGNELTEKTFKKGLTNETECDKIKKLSAMTTTRTLKIKQRKTKRNP